MRFFGKLTLSIILILNLLCIALLLLAAYSPWFAPATHPRLSCLGLTFPIFLAGNICFFVFWLIVRYRLAVVPVLGFLLCAPQIRAYIPFNLHTGNVPEQAIKILSYNIMSFADLQKTKTDKNPTLQYLSESEADIICLQEYNPASGNASTCPAAIEKALKAYPYKQVNRIGAKHSGNHLACYSKHPILSTKRIEYESQSNGSVVYEIKIGGDTITLINNHLESNKLTASDKELYTGLWQLPETEKMKQGAAHLIRKLAEAQRIRAIQADAINEAIRSSAHAAVIVCGDFNDSPISYTHRTIGSSLNDAFTSSGRGLGISYNQNRFYFRIDHILTSKPAKSYNCTVDKSIKSSDHYPIWCYVTLENE